MTLAITQAQFALKQSQKLMIESLIIEPKQFWAVIGENGSGKSALGLALSSELTYIEGSVESNFQRIALFSFEQQQRILAKIFQDRNNDSVSPDDFGLTARQIILNGCDNVQLCAKYAEILQIEALLERPFMQLSTGESRKVLFCQMLVSQPDLLILDEPFEGLDVQSVAAWKTLLNELAADSTIVLITNRLSDLPEAVSHIALLDKLSLSLQGEKTWVEQQAVYFQRQFAESQAYATLPESITPPIMLDGNPFELRNVTVKYGDKLILNNLSWTVKPHQHWWIKGENGAGKSTLLSLITGDHPQGFSNEIYLFGRKRGSGETIWEIKQNLGYVSSQLHMDYRVNCSALAVVASGFFDSIGVYQQLPSSVRLKALEWLACLGLSNMADKPFRSLSWGQQRLLLIARAMVKHPPILILDEPLHGLDGANRTIVKQFIEQLISKSQTQLLFVSHQAEDAPKGLTHLFEFIPTEQGYRYQQSSFKEKGENFHE